MARTVRGPRASGSGASVTSGRAPSAPQGLVTSRRGPTAPQIPPPLRDSSHPAGVPPPPRFHRPSGTRHIPQGSHRPPNSTAPQGLVTSRRGPTAPQIPPPLRGSSHPAGVPPPPKFHRPSGTRHIPQGSHRPPDSTAPQIPPPPKFHRPSGARSIHRDPTAPQIPPPLRGSLHPSGVPQWLLTSRTVPPPLSAPAARGPGLCGQRLRARAASEGPRPALCLGDSEGLAMVCSALVQGADRNTQVLCDVSGCRRISVPGCVSTGLALHRGRGADGHASYRNGLQEQS
nr:basic salivary proline-rich protein 2 isoform X2 [Taeniopygia guttata]